jgi:hypothetical protein
MSNAGTQLTAAVLGILLQNATSEIFELEKLLKSGTIDPRVLNEFRDAVDQIRGTAWAVQQWIGLQESGDPYELLPALSAQRVRRATQLTKDLTIDLESVDIGLETPGLKQLFQAVNALHERLTRVVGKGSKL